MAGVLEYVRDVIYNRNDPRSKDWFLVTGPGPILTIVVTYVYFSVSAGPKYMRDKKPYTLKNTLIVYNFIQVLLSMFLVYEGYQSGWGNGYSFSCQPVDYSNDPKAIRILTAVYYYFLCKLIELLDTVFFVLRKKQRQISFLHVYHHGMMPICAWIGVRYVGGGHPTLLGMINSFIHIFMYTYYMLSAFGPHMQKYLWWKKYLTLMQLIQFSIILVHNLNLLLWRTDCHFPRFLICLLVLNAALFLYLFGSFYLKNYKESNQVKKNEKEVPEQVANSNAHIKAN